MAKKKVKGLWWLIGAVAIGGVVGLLNIQFIQAATSVKTVWVAAKPIPVDQKIPMDALKQEQRPTMGLPADVIRDPSEVVGKYSKTTVLPGQVIEKGMVDDATDLRALVRRYGPDYVGFTIQLDSADTSLSLLHPGDTVAVVGTFTTGPQNVKTRLIQEAVPVVAVVPEEKKIVVAVSRESALELARDKALGKISVSLDPLPFEPGHQTPNLVLDIQGPPTVTQAPATTGSVQTQSQAQPSGQGQAKPQQ